MRRGVILFSLQIGNALRNSQRLRAAIDVQRRYATLRNHMSPRLLFAGLFFCALAAAQTFSFGVVGGASLTQDFKSTFTYEPPPGPGTLTDYSDSEHYIVGGMIEFQLTKNWSIEVDGLFHPLRYEFGIILPNGTLMGGSPSPVITWEFPALAKYRFRWRSWSPFLEAGPTFRTAGNLNGTNPSHYGLAAGAGVEARLGKFRIAPELRYIRWAEDSSSGTALTRSDQVELLTSFTTGGFEGGHAFGPHISLGVMAGATLIPDFRSVTVSQTSTFTDMFSSSPGAFLLGPMVEIGIAGGFFFEGDAIHQPMRTTIRGGFNGDIFSNTQTFNTWSFPLLGKYKFSAHGVQPFLEAGPAFRDAPQPQGLSPYGVTAGAGIEKHLWRLAIAPSMRYTHWGRYSPATQGALVPFENQVAVLAGVSF
jgi:hypothetical protein